MCNRIPKFKENIIPIFNECDYRNYCDDVIKDYKNIKSYFPLLKLTMPPTRVHRELYVTGNLIPVEVLNKCSCEEQINKYSLNILSIYPSNFPNEYISVEDFYNKINWSNIPEKHRHINIHKKNNRKVICTHHPNGEINLNDLEDRSVAILFSAWKLYIQYIKFLQDGKWTLKDLNHGDAAIHQLKREGNFFESK